MDIKKMMKALELAKTARSLLYTSVTEWAPDPVGPGEKKAAHSSLLAIQLLTDVVESQAEIIEELVNYINRGRPMKA